MLLKGNFCVVLLVSHRFKFALANVGSWLLIYVSLSKGWQLVVSFMKAIVFLVFFFYLL